MQPWASALPSLSLGAGRPSPSPGDPGHRQAQGLLLAREVLQPLLTLPHPPPDPTKLLLPKTPHWNLCSVYHSSSATHLSRPTKSHHLFETLLDSTPYPSHAELAFPLWAPWMPPPGQPWAHCISVNLLILCCPSLPQLSRESWRAGVLQCC